MLTSHMENCIQLGEAAARGPMSFVPSLWMWNARMQYVQLCCCRCSLYKRANVMDINFSYWEQIVWPAGPKNVGEITLLIQSIPDTHTDSIDMGRLFHI